MNHLTTDGKRSTDKDFWKIITDKIIKNFFAVKNSFTKLIAGEARKIVLVTMPHKGARLLKRF